MGRKSFGFDVSGLTCSVTDSAPAWGSEQLVQTRRLREKSPSWAARVVKSLPWTQPLFLPNLAFSDSADPEDRSRNVLTVRCTFYSKTFDAPIVWPTRYWCRLIKRRLKIGALMSLKVMHKVYEESLWEIGFKLACLSDHLEIGSWTRYRTPPGMLTYSQDQ